MSASLKDLKRPYKTMFEKCTNNKVFKYTVINTLANVAHKVSNIIGLSVDAIKLKKKMDYHQKL